MSNLPSPNLTGGFSVSPFVPDTSTGLSPWDTIYIGGNAWRGKIEIEGAARSYKWDVKSGYGILGAQETLVAIEPPEFTITFYIWTDSQYGPFVSFLQNLFIEPSKFPGGSGFDPKQPKGQTIYHPQLSVLGINAVIVKSIGAIEKVSDDLVFKCAVKVQEFTPPIPFVAPTPDKSADPAQQPFFTPYEQAQQRQIQDLSNRAAQSSTPGGMP